MKPRKPNWTATMQAIRKEGEQKRPDETPDESRARKTAAYAGLRRIMCNRRIASN